MIWYCLAHGQIVSTSYQLLDYTLSESIFSFAHINEQKSKMIYFLDGSTHMSEGFSCQEQSSLARLSRNELLLRGIKCLTKSL